MALGFQWAGDVVKLRNVGWPWSEGRGFASAVVMAPFLALVEHHG